MKKYEVTMVSKEDQRFVFTTGAEDEVEAAQKGLERVKELHWDIYDYRVEEVSES